jgi:uncharacterized membrane protein (DUF4010 family)
VILLALAFVLLPVVPSEPIGPYGGISPARTLTLVVVLASISYAGYIAVRLLGSTRGELVAGAVGGLVSSTAVTITNARRSKEIDSPATLAAGAIGAGAISFLRTAVLVATLAPVLVRSLVPALVAGAAAMLVHAALLARRGGGDGAEQAPKNPFELDAVIKMALMLVAISFLARAGSQYFGNSGLLIVSALSGLADVDAATVAVTGMMRSLTVAVGAFAIALAIFSNVFAKAVYATVWGSAPFRNQIWIASVAAVLATSAVLFLNPWQTAAPAAQPAAPTQPVANTAR